jgi:hypothetical protein
MGGTALLIEFEKTIPAAPLPQSREEFAGGAGGPNSDRYPVIFPNLPLEGPTCTALFE